MNKIKQNNLYSILIFIACYLILAAIAVRPIGTFDAFWHLQMGKDLVENGLSPWVDHYSFSFYGKEISTVPVMFQVLLYKFVSVFGENEGFYYIKLLYITLLMSALYVYFMRIKASWFVAFVLLPILVYFIHLRLLVRPEIFSNVLVVICFILYLNAQRRFATKELVYICLLLLFWVNYHSPIIGYIIIFGLFLEKAIHKYLKGDESFTWRFWFVWGCVIFLIGFIRPNGQHFLITVYALMTEDFSKYTQEYMSSYQVFSKNIIVHASWVLSIYVAIWSLIKKQYGFALIAVLLTYFSWSTVRLVTVAMLVNFCMLALYFSQYYASRHQLDIRPSIKKTLLALASGIAFFSYYHVGLQALASVENKKNQEVFLETRYPVKLVDYMNRYQEEGNVLNVMNYGGYLINKLDPGFKVFFDGRTNILYPVDFLKYNVFLLKNTTELNKIIKRYDVKYSMYKNTPEIFMDLNKNNRLILNYADSGYLLFSEKKRNAFPLASTLLVFPSCWKDSWEEGVRNEIELADSLLQGQKYELQLVLSFMQGYLSHADKHEFFDDLDLETLETDGVRRIATYFSLKAGNNQVSRTIFKLIKSKNEYDMLLQSYHLAINGEYELSESLLYYFYTVTKYVKQKNLAFNKIAIMVHILDILEKNTELKKFETTYKAELEGKLRQANYPVEDTISFEQVCKQE